MFIQETYLRMKIELNNKKTIWSKYTIMYKAENIMSKFGVNILFQFIKKKCKYIISKGQFSSKNWKKHVSENNIVV